MSDSASKDSARQYGSSLPDLSKLTLGPGETSEDNNCASQTSTDNHDVSTKVPAASHVPSMATATPASVPMNYVPQVPISINPHAEYSAPTGQTPPGHPATLPGFPPSGPVSQTPPGQPATFPGYPPYGPVSHPPTPPPTHPQPFGFYPYGYPPMPHTSTTPSDANGPAYWNSIQQQIWHLQQQLLHAQQPVPSSQMTSMAPPPLVPGPLGPQAASFRPVPNPVVPPVSTLPAAPKPTVPNPAPPVAHPPVAPVAPPSGITQIVSEPSIPPPVNSAIPVGLKYDVNFPLYVISQPGEFDQWLSALISHLRTSKLGHLLPNEYGSLSQPLTNGETLGLNWISANYLKKSAHPTWMTDSLKTGVTPAQTLIEAIGLHQRHNNADAMLEKLRKLKFSGDIRAFAYVAQVKQIIDPLLAMSNPALESIIKNTILRNLHGDYQPLANRFRTSITPYTIQEIFDRILAQFAAFDKTAKPASSTSTSGGNSRRKTCTHCHATNHTTARCPKAPSAGPTPSSTGPTSYRPRSSDSKAKTKRGPASYVKRNHNVNLVDPDPSEDIARHLRHATPPFTPAQFLMIDSGCHTSIVNNAALLHDVKPPDATQLAASNRSPLAVTCRGDLHLQLYNGKTLKLPAYCVPENAYNLLSTTDMEAQDAYFCATHRRIETKDEQPLAMVSQTGNYNWLSSNHVIFPDDASPTLINAVREKYPMSMVHQLFGHVNIQSIKKS